MQNFPVMRECPEGLNEEIFMVLFALAEISKSNPEERIGYLRDMPYGRGAYGNGVILPKKYKILNEYVIALPKGAGSEPRSVAVAETNEYVIDAVHFDIPMRMLSLTNLKSLTNVCQRISRILLNQCFYVAT